MSGFCLRDSERRDEVFLVYGDQENNTMTHYIHVVHTTMLSGWIILNLETV